MPSEYNGECLAATPRVCLLCLSRVHFKYEFHSYAVCQKHARRILPECGLLLQHCVRCLAGTCESSEI